MIGTEDQWLLSINGDEINSDELSEFKLEDEAGLGLPILEMNFNTSDKEKMKEYTTVGKILDIGIGKSEISEKNKFMVFKKMFSEGITGTKRWFFKVWAVMGAMDYLEKQRQRTFNKTTDMKKSNEVWATVMNKYGIDPKTVNFNDKMLWLQYNITDRQFLQELVWHGYYASDDPCLSAITRDNRAIYKPLSKLKNVKGVIGNVDGVDYLTNYYEVIQNEGFLGSWGGGKRIAPFHNVEEGANDEVWSNVSQQILGTGIREDARRVTEYQLINDNVHDNWIKANEQNRILRASLNALNIDFHFHEYKSLFPLDYIKVQWKDVQKDSPEIITPITGEWIVLHSRILVSSNTYQQHVKVARETML